MNTMQKTQEDCEKTEQSQQKGEFLLEDITKAILRAFQDIRGKIDVKHLWTDNGVHRFRVNCWTSVMIHHSEFVYVTEENGKLTVRREE